MKKMYLKPHVEVVQLEADECICDPSNVTFSLDRSQDNDDVVFDSNSRGSFTDDLFGEE